MNEFERCCFYFISVVLSCTLNMNLGWSSIEEEEKMKRMWSSLTCSSFINLGTGSFLEELQRYATKLWSHWGQKGKTPEGQKGQPGTDRSFRVLGGATAAFIVHTVTQIFKHKRRRRDRIRHPLGMTPKTSITLWFILCNVPFGTVAERDQTLLQIITWHLKELIKHFNKTKNHFYKFWNKFSPLIKTLANSF